MTPVFSRVLLALAVSAALAACSSTPPAQPGVPQRISFIDTEAFERQVQAALGDGVEVIDIPMLVPASANSLPPRLSRIVSNVQDAGGKVNVKAVPEETGKSLALLSMLPALLDAAQSMRQRMAYRGYDAEVMVLDGNVTRVQLKKSAAR
ncbi:MAG: hypothetical protein H7Y33_11350 [Cytophagales bacterium]|nr:hypothetical protein [Rhizobacter sp.]